MPGGDPEAASGDSLSGLGRLLDPLVAGGLGVSIVLRILQGGAAADMAQPSLNFAADALLAATVVLFALRAAAHARLVLPPLRVLVPLAALVAAAWLSLAGAEDLYAALRRACHWTAAGLLACLAYSHAARKGGAAALVALVIGAVGVVAALAAKERLIDIPEARARYAADLTIADIPPELRGEFEARLHTDQASGPFVIPNGLGAFLAMGALAAGGVAVGCARAGRRGAAALAGAVAAASLAGIALAAQKGGWLGLAGGGAVAALALVPARARRARAALEAGITAGVLAGIVATAATSSATFERLPGGLGLSAAVRHEYAEAALRLFRERPLLGVGAGNFGVHMTRVKDARAEETRFVHDDYLEALAEMGPLGAGALAALWLLAIRLVPVEGDGQERPCALAAGGFVGALLVAPFGLRYADPLVLFAAGGAIFVIAIALAPRLRTPVAAAAVAAFAIQSAIDFLHPEHGILAAALALAAAASPAPPLVLRLPAAARVAVPAAAFGLFAALAYGLLPRAFLADALRAPGASPSEEEIRAAAGALPIDPLPRILLADLLAEDARRAPGDPAVRERALAAYRDAVAGRRGLADVKARAGLLAQDLGSDPAPWFAAAVEAYPTHPRYRFLLGRTTRSREHLEAALALDCAVRHERLRLSPEERTLALRLLAGL